uniref:Defective in cullin neddylation protein n=1 Tax=Aegilops tauschii subsp. strangulata TaxID=200361 RepID=A0A453K642_AEGTS
MKLSYNIPLILQGQKSLPLETAIGMWRLLFAERHWPLIDHWCQFLQVCLKWHFCLIPFSDH